MSDDQHGLKGLLDALRSRWKLGLAVALCFIAASAAYVSTLPSQYDGVAIVSVAPRAGVSNAGADTVRVIGPKYVAFVTSPQVASVVARETGVSRTDVQDALDATIQPDTGNITITARLESPILAARVANAAAAEAVDFGKSDELLTSEIVAGAIADAVPAAPPRRLIIAASVLVALLLGVATAVLVERLRPRIRSWRDIVNSTGLPVIGRLPDLKEVRDEPLEAFKDPAVGAAFRALRLNLELLMKEGDHRTLLITSAHGGDGKTTVSALIAEAFGRRGSNVLLIDADMRRAGLSRLLGLETDGGLAEVLVGESDLRDQAKPGWTPGLSILPTSVAPEAGDALAKRFPELLRTVRAVFDPVIVDGPPMLGADESHTIGSMTDAVALVVPNGATEDSVEEAILALKSSGANILGIIGNRLNSPRSYSSYG